MDAAEDKDVQLQRASSELLLEFESSLPRFLWISSSKSQVTPDQRPSQRLRKTVRHRTTADLIKLLEPFQEWPQLLDPRLSTITTTLVNAYIEHLHRRRHDGYKRSEKRPGPTLTMPQAICKMLYTLCKIRGPKVISRFFNNEPRYIEPMLDAFQEWSSISPGGQIGPTSKPSYMTWEERYVMLLWLSHLMLTPFDLASVSSEGLTAEDNLPEIGLPLGLPSIALRVITISAEHLRSPSKEREAAVALLARLVLRPDMLQAGLLKALVTWAVSSLTTESPVSFSIYAHIGVLSFIAHTVALADAAAIQPFLLPLFECIQKINAQTSPLSKDIMSSALARKVNIKILRAITTIILQLNSTSLSLVASPGVGVILEEVIEHLLTALADKDTPVRFSASKALSVITVKLEPEMASEVVQAVVSSLEENVIWEEYQEDLFHASNDTSNQSYSGTKQRNLGAVNAVQWQGLILTLAHLLFRRSPPPKQLPIILNALILALSFEQRSSTGNSVGTNVRDAACFGIWSLARRYTTKELLAVDTSTVRAAECHHQRLSILQILANELVVAASIDPSGNIRRGASAALQELIGRHPDTTDKGVSLIQIVDYHAVALRSRALEEVAIGAAELSSLYWDALMDGLLGWRAICAPDADSRRLSALTISKFAVVRGLEGIESSIEQVRESLSKLENRNVEKRHGLLLALVAILQKASGNFEQDHLTVGSTISQCRLWEIFHSDVLFNDRNFTSSTLRPELTAEAACSLVSALAKNASGVSDWVTRPSSETLACCTHIVTLSLVRSEDTVIRCAAEAAENLFNVLENDVKEDMVKSWLGKLSLEKSTRLQSPGNGLGCITALGTIFHRYEKVTPTCQAILDTLTTQSGPRMDIDTRVAALKSLRVGIIPSGVMTESISNVLSNSLEDYTIDQRGDVGSLVRIEAIRVVQVALQHDLLDEATKQRLVSRVVGLAVEKLDKVRFCAWSCLENTWAYLRPGENPPK
ncbi:MAG: hypothetical protein Q9187_005556 [Circinaria calcarea]